MYTIKCFGNTQIITELKTNYVFNKRQYFRKHPYDL